MAATLELNRTVIAEYGGCDVVGVYAVDGETLHVAYDRHTKSAPLYGSNPEVLAHVLLVALLDEIVGVGA